MCIPIYTHTFIYSHTHHKYILCMFYELVFVLGMWDSAVHEIDIALSLSLHFNAKYSHSKK